MNHEHDDLHRTLDELAKTLEAYVVNINAEQAEAEEYKGHLRQVGREVLALGERLTVVEGPEGTAEHRLMVLERRMENVLARLDGHDLGFATMALDDDGKKSLARIMHLAHVERTMDPDKEGTSES